LGCDLKKFKMGFRLSGKMDGRRDVETFRSNLQMRINLIKMGEERSVVSHWKMRKELGKKNIQGVS